MVANRSQVDAPRPSGRTAETLNRCGDWIIYAHRKAGLRFYFWGNYFRRERRADRKKGRIFERSLERHALTPAKIGRTHQPESFSMQKAWENSYFTFDYV